MPKRRCLRKTTGFNQLLALVLLLQSHKFCFQEQYADLASLLLLLAVLFEIE